MWESGRHTSVPMHHVKRGREGLGPGGSLVPAPCCPRAPRRTPHFGERLGRGVLLAGGRGEEAAGIQTCLGWARWSPRPRCEAGARSRGEAPRVSLCFCGDEADEGWMVGPRLGHQPAGSPAPGAARVPTVPSAGGDRRLDIPPGAGAPRGSPPTPASPSAPSPGCPQNMAGLGIVFSFLFLDGRHRPKGRGGRGPC